MDIFAEAQRSNAFGRLDPRARVVAALVFALPVCLGESPYNLAFALVAAALVALVSGVLGRRMLSKLAGLNAFMLVLILFMPLSIPGEPVLGLSGLAWSAEGFQRAFLIAIKANALALMFMALLGTMDAASLTHALERLGSPRKLCHLLHFMARYIEVFHQEYHRARDAMRSRGFRPRCDVHTCRTYGYLIGLLLTRSFDRSERVFAAMKCRGFDGRLRSLSKYRLAWWDLAFVSAIVCGAVAMGWWEWQSCSH